MASLEHLDLLLGEALEYVIEASNEVREIEVINQKDTLRQLARTVSDLWRIRENIYDIKPELKRDFILECEQDKARYEKLSELQKRAYEAERCHDRDSALILYDELLLTSRFGYFRLIAEAGIYRLSKSISLVSDARSGSGSNQGT